ncbi:elongator complex protein 5 [Dioscorea cayenensis subsp. rotundata]|uniref:Elongator complex protein 5 n=1 Tax=Dioscorea cayennensis subsp. rotundata TaxID=55577 RepID=A0AB40D0W2_DIOCR|nr:elongator complex protein 5 [Dioscorea cayenensis subsp. rotundata]
MAESVCRSLRDGSLEGEHAPALSISDTLHSPLGSHVFHHFLYSLASNIAASKSQARALVLVAYRRSPSFYFDLLKSSGVDPSLFDKKLLVLDCHSDPLGWKDRLLKSANSAQNSAKSLSSVFKSVKDISKLLSLILELGQGLVGHGKEKFAVAIDSVSDMLRHASLQSVARLISNLRSHDNISCIFWLIHSDLHEPRVSSSLEYISTMTANLEPIMKPNEGQRRVSENLYNIEQNSYRGKLHVHLKRRNGRVKLHSEEVHVEQVGIKILAMSSENAIVNQSLLPKVQFNLQLSEKERDDRAKVVLPFEHQGNGETIQIYDGRQSLSEGQKDPHLKGPSITGKTNTDTSTGNGEIHYLRDSDDEQPDSDEDPDDDLDI